MENRSERILLVSAVLAFGAWLAGALLTRHTHLLAPAAVAPFLAIALALSLLVFARQWFARRAQEEQRDKEWERKERAETTIFREESAEFEPFSIARSRDQFERFAVPLAAPLLAAWMGYWAWRLLRGLFAEGNPPVADRLLAAAFLAFFSFLFFLLSRYLLGLSRQPECRLLRGPGIAHGMASFACLFAALAAVISQVAAARTDRITASALTLALALLAVEALLNTIGELYRPRRGRTLNTAYESRLGRLLTDPASWARSVVQTLDYQFGFQVSETWFFRFLEKALLPLLLFQLAVLYGLSCLVFIGPDEEGILEHFGRPNQPAWRLEPGFHAKWPWPFETVRRFPAQRVLSLHVGHHHEGAEPDILLWTVPHYREEALFLSAGGAAPADEASGAVPVNLLAVSVPVEYRITNVYQFAYNHADPARTLEQIAYRSMSIEIAGRDLFRVMGPGQTETAAAVRDRMRKEADRLGLGIEVLFVGLQGVHPPVAVADAFESVIGAMETREADILEARAYTNRVLPTAAAEAVQARHAAEAYRARRMALSQAEVQRFEKQLVTYRRSPQVFKTRAYLDTLLGALAHTRKYIVSATPPREVIQFDFEERLNPDLFDLGPGIETGKGKGP